MLTVRECARALLRTYTRDRRWLAWFILALFAGIRPTEISRLSWSEVDLEEGHVILDAPITKTRRRRVVILGSAAIAWLRAARQLGFPLPVPSE